MGQLITDIRTLRRLGRTTVKESRLQDFRTGGKRMMWEPWKDPNWREYKEANERVSGWLCIILLKLRII